MTRAEKAGYETYPEIIDYSTIANMMHDYNAEKRKAYIAGYKQGYKDAIDEACAFIENIKSHDYDYLKSDRWEGVCWTKIKTTELAKDLRKHMEEQL